MLSLYPRVICCTPIFNTPHVHLLSTLSAVGHSNGYVTFPAEGPTAAHYSFTPSDLGSLSGAPMIAAYWADADLQAGNGGVFYRESVAEFELDRASHLIHAWFGETYRPSL